MSKALDHAQSLIFLVVALVFHQAPDFDIRFLGIGAQPPIPSWGAMIKDHYGYIIMDKAYLALIPGAAILLMVLAFTLVGNGIRDAIDVKGTS